jgi:hypothetical protein
VSNEQNLAVVRALYDAYARGDSQPLFESMADDGQIGFAATKRHFDFAGMFKGRKGAERVIGYIASQVQWLKYECRELIANGDRVVALTGGRIKARNSDRTADIDMVDVIRLRDGKIVEFVEYFDSATVHELIASKTKPARAKAAPKAKTKKPAGAKAKARPKRKSK